MECSNVTTQLSWQLNCPAWGEIAAANTVQYIGLDSFLGERKGKLGLVFHDTSHHELTFHKI